jgi:hypothetical protein
MMDIKLWSGKEDRKSFKTTAKKTNLSDCHVICSEVREFRIKSEDGDE